MYLYITGIGIKMYKSIPGTGIKKALYVTMPGTKMSTDVPGAVMNEYSIYRTKLSNFV